MSGVTVAFLAQIFIGVSLVIDKIFFGDSGERRVIPYVFWISIMSCFGLVFFFFGFTIPSPATIGLCFLAALSFLLMLICYYKVLSIGEATEAVPVVGGFAPLATYLAGSILEFAPLNAAEAAGFSLLITGGFILFFSDRSKIIKIIPWTLVASAFTGSTNILEKIVFQNTANFATGYALMKSATLIIGMSMLAVPYLRKNIFIESKDTSRDKRILYFVNRAIAGTGSLLIFYAIKLENHPAIVESINGARYIIVFILAYAITKLRPDILKETIHGWRFFSKITATLLILIGLTGLGLQRNYESFPVPEIKDISWGVTYSELMAEKLKIDRDEALRAIVTDLKPSGIRLVAYWDRIEKQIGIYDFRSLDAQMNICRDAGIPVILAIGQRVPRWPECHIPLWAESKRDLPKYLRTIVERYKNYNNLKYWQVENEPYLLFGECPPSDSELLRKEAALVRELDTSRKIVMTDGGEFGDWYRASSISDVFGTTLYRKIYSRFFGQMIYPLTPEFYPMKQDIVKFFTGKKDQEFIIIELGVEPWTYRQIYEMTPEEQIAAFTIDEFRENIEYTRHARFDTCYLWGAEWWYYLKIKHGDDSYWEYAGKLMRGGGKE
jgi:uncharacterized membrane protein